MTRIQHKVIYKTIKLQYKTQTQANGEKGTPVTIIVVVGTSCSAVLSIPIE